MASLSGLLSASVLPPPPLRVARPWPWRMEDPASVLSASLPRLRTQCVASFTPKGRRIATSHSPSLDLEIHADDPRVVSLVHSASHIVDRVFRFQTPVIDATLAHFSGRQRTSRRRRKVPKGNPLLHEEPPFVCVLARSDCISVYAPNGEMYEVTLPFHADRILALSPAMGGGLLLQRRPLTPAPSAAATAAAFSPSHARSPPGTTAAAALRAALVASNSAQMARPRFFTLAHPLEEVKPIALQPPTSSVQRRAKPTATEPKMQFLADPALDLVDVCVLPKSDEDLEDEEADAAERGVDPERALLVCFHRHDRRFLVFEMTRHRPPPAEEGEEGNAHETPTKYGTLLSPGTPTTMTSFVSPAKMRQQQREVAMMEQYFKSHIVPERSVQLVWTSPCLDAMNDSSSGTSNNTSSSRAFDLSKSCSWLHQRAFLVSSNDDDQQDDMGFTGDVFPLRLGLLDERFGVLLMKPLRLSASDRFRERETDLHVMRCQSAVPLRPLDEEDETTSTPATVTDVLIASRDGERLFLLSDDRVLAELMLPQVGRSYQRHQLQLTTAGRGKFGVCLRSKSGRSEARWFNHPLRISASSLLRSVLRVLKFALPTKDYLTLYVSTIALVSARHQSKGDDAEWSAFSSLLLASAKKLTGSPAGDETIEHGAAKKAKPTASDDYGESKQSEDMTADDLVNSVLQSSFAALYESANAAFLGGFDSLSSQPNNGLRRQVSTQVKGADVSTDTFGRLVTALHLLHEDFRLSVAHSQDSIDLATLLCGLCSCLGLQPLATYYRRQHAIVGDAAIDERATSLPEHSRVRLQFEDEMAVPDVFVWLRDQLQGYSSSSSSWGGGDGGFGSFEPVTSQFSRSEFPRLHGVNEWKQAVRASGDAAVHPLWRTTAICQVFDLLFSSDLDDDDFNTQQQRYDSSRLTDLMEFLTAEDEMGSKLSLEDLPVGIRFVILETIRVYREDPPHDVSERVCVLIGRRDLASRYRTSRSDSSSGGQASGSNTSSSLVESTRLRSRGQKTLGDGSSDGATREVSDGLVNVVVSSQRFFPTDQRLKEVARLLRSNRPLCLRLEKTSDMSDQDYVLHQQARLLLLCKRSMALSVARGMVTIGTFDLSTVQNQAWQLSVPALPLAGRTPPTNATVLLDVSGYAKELTHWPQFHNGCATGLRLPAKDLSSIITRYWIKYHRPSANDFQRLPTQGTRNQQQQHQQAPSSTATARDLEEAHAAHAGVLLGLGLNGHLKCLSMADVYNYLSLSNEFITVAILLGMAATAARSRRKRKSASAAMQAARRRQRARGDIINTQQDGATQDDMQGPTGASQAVDADVDMDVNVPASAPAVTETQPQSEDQPGKTALPGGVPGLELSLERSVSKMLCLHIPSLLPPAFAEFSVPASTQTAALLGLGILYQGSGHRLMTELLLTEITRSPASAQFVSNQHSASSSNQSSASSSSTPFDQHEGYSLAAGLALGLVLLGRGGVTSGDPGLADLGLEEKLYKYIVGGAAQPPAAGGGDSNSSTSYLYRGRKWKPFGSGLDSGLRSTAGGASANNGANNRNDANKASSSGDPRSSWRGEHVNIGVTACGSALALAFMYMKSSNKSCASQLAVPDTLILLDYVRPDILLIRTLAKNLVMWDSIEPTKTWVEMTQVPEQLRDAYRIIQRQGSASSSSSLNETLPDHADLRSICESYANIVAGACFSLGLRFAGTSDSSARETLREFVLFFRDMRSRSALLGGDFVAAATDRVTIERCLAVCAQSLALVDAGTGNLETFTLLRSINLKQRVDNELTYGNHMALSMAIGLLFLGGGRATVSRSNEAIAALVVALYPISAMNTADNKYHLQAFRHLYTLAVDTSRHVEMIDTTSGEPCSVELQVVSQRDRPGPMGSSASVTKTFKTPCLLPELDTVDRIIVRSGDDFFPVDIRLQDKDLDELDQDDEDQQWGRARRRSSLFGIKRNGSRTTANDNRVKLLLEEGTILLERRTAAPSAAVGAEILGISSALAVKPLTKSFSDHDGQILYAFTQYFTTKVSPSVHNTEETTWWRERFSQLEQLGALRASASRARLWPSHLSVLFEVFTLHHPRQRLQSLEGLWNVKLVQEFHRIDPFRSLVASANATSISQHHRDFIEWLRAQTEEALRHRWRTESGRSFPSLAIAQRDLLRDQDRTHAATDDDDSLLLAAMFVLFDAPSSVWNDAADWQRRMLRALAMASASSNSAFAVDRFLLHTETELSPHEQAFWLRLVSCFLFSV